MKTDRSKRHPPSGSPSPFADLLARLAEEGGYRRWESGGLWVRSRPRFLHVVGPDVKRIGGGDLLLDFGIWVPELVTVVKGSPTELHDADDCHIVPFALHVDPVEPSAGAILRVLDAPDEMQTLDDVYQYLEHDGPRRWPPGGGLRHLYLAALALLLGSQDVYWEAEAAAKQLTGTPWYDAACHIYAMVATRE